MEQKDNIDKITKFLESLERMRQQLKDAEDTQKCLLSRMLDLKKDMNTDTEEYQELEQRSKALQEQIDKYRPVYLERLEMIKDIKKQHKK